MGAIPAFQLGMLVAAGLTDGGTYTPGVSIALSFDSAYSSGDHLFYVTSGGSMEGSSTCSGQSVDSSATTLTMPASGSVTIVAMRATGYGVGVVYETMTVTAAANPLPPLPPSPPPLVPCPDMGSGWTTKTLDEAVGYKVHHKVEDSLLHLYLEADTTGWLGFGFAEPTSGHMKGADMVTAAVVNGEVVVDDRYAAFAGTTYSAANNYVNGYSGLTAAVDDHADWTIVSGGEADGHTFVWVTRELVTADAQDRPVVAGMNRIVYAYGSTDAVGYHGANRGSGTEVFFGTSSSLDFPRTTACGRRPSTTTSFPRRSPRTPASRSPSRPTPTATSSRSAPGTDQVQPPRHPPHLQGQRLLFGPRRAAALLVPPDG